MGKITIVGLGPGDSRLITMGAWQALNGAGPGRLFLRTAKHPSVAYLVEQGVPFTSFDWVYEEKGTFEQVYQTIADTIAKEASRGQDLVYAVPGSPLVAEQTVQLIRSQARLKGLAVEVQPGMSFLEALYTRLDIDPIQGLTIIDAADLDKLPGGLSAGLVITQVYSRQVASDVKLSLMELYGDEYQVTIARNLSLPDEEISTIPVYQLDRLAGVNHLTSVYVPACPEDGSSSFSLDPVVEVMARLRSPGGCVWDIEQTHPSLRRYIVEEVYEVLEAIDLMDSDKLCEELGDLLLQIVFHARIAEESGNFTMQDVIQTVTEKMIRRHPHVFGDISVRDAAEVIVNWEAIKAREKGGKPASLLDGVPPALPSLMQAYKLQGKASKAGFDWDCIDPVWAKISEELAELREAAARERETETGAPQKAAKEAVEGELGDVLFSVVNLARFLGVEPETALYRTNQKFIRRFRYIEEQAAQKGLNLSNLPLTQLDKLWEEAKSKEIVK